MLLPHCPALHARTPAPTLQHVVEGSFAWTHPLVETQESAVQGLPSSQLRAGPPVHTPLRHTSMVVQKLPSSQGAALGVCTQPVVALQVSSVHTLPSSQLMRVTTQAPFTP